MNNTTNFSNKEILNRAERLLGAEVIQALANTRVIIFGVGGVGSWTAEALARTGIGHITMVDADRVAVSNINRQAEATIDTVGQVKVEAMERMLRAVNPTISLELRAEEYNATTAPTFDLEQYDFIVDAIDSLTPKAQLILNATAAKRPKLFSSMGAALKLDPSKISTAEFWKVAGCPLGAALRHRFRKNKIFPRKKFQCVYSPELQPNRGEILADNGAKSFNKVAVNGSLCHITSIFGMTIAGMIIKQVVDSALAK
jgi:tRNA A37 threonylcarbamoyladenosine dehydratase